MYIVNLLPESYIRERKNQRIKNRVIYGLLIFVAFTLVIYNLLVQLENRQVEQYNSILQANLSLESTVQSFSDPETSLADATEIDSIIGEIMGSKVDYVEMMVLISNSAPDDILISYLSMSDVDGNEACIINASALYYESINEWVSALSEIEGVGTITFSYLASSETPQGGYTLDGESEGDTNNRINFEFRIALK
jgi:hypothetical protein